MNRRACDRCRGLRKRCDCRDGVYPCSRCVNNGAECAHSHSTKTKSRERPDEHVPPGDGKRKRESRPDSAETFWSALADTWILPSLVKLGPSHWGLRNMIYGLLARAYIKGSSELLARATSFIQHMGVDLGQVSGPLSHQVQHTMSTTFDGIDQTPLQAHDRALGYEPKHWTSDYLKQRLIIVTTGINSGHGQIVFSQSFYEMSDKELMESLPVSPNPMTTLAKELFKEESFYRGVQACIYLIEQYKSKTSGPLSVKVPEFRLKTGQLFDFYITYWVEQLDNFVQVYELVPMGYAVTQ